MVRQAILLAALVPTALAFSGTHPVVAWSSHSSDALTAASKSTDTGYFLESLLSDDSVCDHDAIVLVDQLGLHASDLRSLPPSSKLARSLESSAASVELPYMRHSGANPFAGVSEAIAQRCGSRLLSVSAGEVAPHLEAAPKEKHVVCMSMPAVQGTSEYRKGLVAELESTLASELEQVANTFSKYMVVYAGWSQLLQSRQDSDDAPALEFVAPAGSASPSKAAANDGGVLKRYQLLTPGLIVSLFVALFILLPVVFLGVSTLASIQSPVRLDAPKGFNAAEKKNQ
ncbi:hypothetical protein PsYK624_009100 [Phanerochaete sordida]|uniref:Protein BIG1 n=1 Tax=Phanerochaete sordida TaxID=48140 RepID=A0A9P3L7U6_9APHY|nr:hypothetical protein PsYK624_009100 [Phanerochaete sordida]